MISRIENIPSTISKLYLDNNCISNIEGLDNIGWMKNLILSDNPIRELVLPDEISFKRLNV